MLLVMVRKFNKSMLFNSSRVLNLTLCLCFILGDVLVILDLRPDESLFEAGVAREVSCIFHASSLYMIYDNHEYSVPC